MTSPGPTPPDFLTLSATRSTLKSIYCRSITKLHNPRHNSSPLCNLQGAVTIPFRFLCKSVQTHLLITKTHHSFLLKIAKSREWVHFSAIYNESLLLLSANSKQVITPFDPLQITNDPLFCILQMPIAPGLCNFTKSHHHYWFLQT